MATVVVTGSQSGMGLAIRRHLEAAGTRVLGVDLPGKGAEIAADLSQPEGRAAAAEAILARCGGRLDGAVANAGVDSEDVRLVLGLDYFGATDLLGRLRGALAANGRARAVVNVSNSIAITPGIPSGPVEALLAGDLERAAAGLAATPRLAYMVAKTALGRWVRRCAPSSEWAGAGITMNGICPGPVMTPLLEQDLRDPGKARAIRGLPLPLGEFTPPEKIAAVVAFLLGEDARYIVGQLVMVDGGLEALWRGEEWPSPWSIAPLELAKKLGLVK